MFVMLLAMTVMVTGLGDHDQPGLLPATDRGPDP
jgi:hypothetical protein